MFPLGNYLKNHIKTMAKEAGLHKIVKKKESMGICFVGKREFQDFISEVKEDTFVIKQCMYCISSLVRLTNNDFVMTTVHR